MKINWIQDRIEKLEGRVATINDSVERYWAEFPEGTENDAINAFCADITDEEFDPSLVTAEIFESVQAGIEELSCR